METLILALLATPLVFSLVMAFLPKNTSYNVFAGLNLVSVAAVLVLSIMTAGDVLMSGDTASALGLWFHLDSLGAIFVLLIGFIGFLTGLFSLPYVKADIEEGSMPAERAKQYFALFSLFVFTMLLACLSNNMILTWAAVEATTLVHRVPRGYLQEQDRPSRLLGSMRWSAPPAWPSACSVRC